MTDHVSEYLAASRALSKARTDLDAIVKRVEMVAQKFRTKDYRFSFGNSGLSYSIDLMSSMTNTIMDKNDWPDAVRIQTAMMDFLSAQIEAKRAWSRLSVEDREGLQAPAD